MKVEDLIHHHFLNGLYLREAAIPAGMWIRMHKHKYDHMGILAKGTVEVNMGDRKETLHAPAFILVGAGEQHRIVAKTDVLWYCTHVTEGCDESRIDEVLLEG